MSNTTKRGKRARNTKPAAAETAFYEVLGEFNIVLERNGVSKNVFFTPGEVVEFPTKNAANWVENGYLREQTAPSAAQDTTDTTNAPQEPTAAPESRATQGKSITKTIEVVCPTLNRPAEAERLEAALANCAVPDGWQMKVNVHRETEPRALTQCVNELVAGSDADVVVVLADHIVPKPNAIDRVIAAFGGNLDRMVGLNIVNMPPAPGVREYCFFALGRKFIERFPNAQVLCPDYYHFFGDTELGEFASGEGLFTFAKDAEIETYHVNNGLANQDATWRASRSRKTEDYDTRTSRQSAGYVWGASFNRVNG